MAGLFTDTLGVARCAWCQSTPLYQHYHDNEWGFPVADERRLFEKICLEGFQSGLSWLTILNKREAFRAGFANFDAKQVAAFGEADVQRLLGDAGIVRHQGKIRSTINNAQRLLELRREFGSLANYVWAFEPEAATRDGAITADTLSPAATTAISVTISKDLKKRGWSFVGPTTVYAFMQAMGLVNDHLEGCASRAPALAARAAFQRPGKYAPFPHPAPRSGTIAGMEHAEATDPELLRRSTRQRSAIHHAIHHAGQPLLPAEILTAAQQAIPALGMATVYRNIKLLIDAGEVQAVELPGEPARYESTHHGHHHHFQCRVCQQVFDVHGCPGDLAQFAPGGFQVERHELTLYGVCANCSGK